MNPYQQIVQQRNINYLVHFTKSSNLPFILGDEQLQSTPNGIVSDELLPQEIERNDKQRNDQHIEYVCCSVEFPNLLFQYSQKIKQLDELFDEWAFIYIDPSIIDNTTLFSPINAATGNGINLDSGPDAFENIFGQKIDYYKKYGQGMRSREVVRPEGLPNNYASSIQAEVMIKDKIPKEYIREIRFPSNTFDYEQSRLKLCHVDLSNIRVSSFNESAMWRQAKQWPKD